MITHIVARKERSGLRDQCLIPAIRCAPYGLHSNINPSLDCIGLRFVIARHEATQGTELRTLGCFVSRNDPEVGFVRFPGSV